MGTNYQKSLYRDYSELITKYDKVCDSNRVLINRNRILEKEAAKLRKQNALKEARIKDIEAQNAALKNEIAHLIALQNINGTNSGIPTSKTPINKKKRIPNTRPKTTKHIGGQKGHKKHRLEPLHEDEITENESHELSKCPECGGNLKQTEGETHKDEIEYEFVVRKIRHHFPHYECEKCGKKIRSQIPLTLRNDVQYGSRVKALALCLGNEGNVSMNKISHIIYGLSDREIKLSEGFIAKLQRWAAGRLIGFITDIKKAIIERKLLYWDDTVIMINKRRGCLRFYGDERLALYTAHEKKNKEGIDEDGILKLLLPNTSVMHDHNRVNYNKDYSFSNVECNVHLMRDLQKVTDNLGHKWSKEMKELLTGLDHERNEAIARGEKFFSDEKVEEFNEKFERLMVLATEESEAEAGRYYTREENALITRIYDFKDNYLAWIMDFDIPFSNNLSEKQTENIGTISK